MKLCQKPSRCSNSRQPCRNIGDSNLLVWLPRKPNHLTNLPSNLFRSALNRSQLSSDHSITSVSKANPSILPPGQAKNWVNVDASDEDGTSALILAAGFGHAKAENPS
ncbi:hypothetical protein O181_087522 [Austropuccinia psidii MF-1]|uniref:Uncharacterized protein n=1 Tax=Austropuccinia psidii MF-1 TaxID=1389203 RepID=A0A9Q3P3B3_9BASI|nr:hypothetical protein [Austropuccinia psidii MF-1]